MKNQPAHTEWVILYARVSSREQAGEEHFSIDAQLHEMREYAAARGWSVAAEFVDEGLSGEKWARPGLEALLAMAAAGRAGVLLVHELSRLSRSLHHTLEIFELLGRHNVGFAAVKDPDFNFADPTQRLFLTILAAVNQYYLDNLRMHIRKSKRQRAKAGLYNAPLVPFGYRPRGGPQEPPVVVPEEAAAVRLAFEQYATGLQSLMGLAELLNARGYHTRPLSGHPQGRRFSKDNLSEMLRNPFYMGQVRYRAAGSAAVEVYAGQQAPIVSPALWEKCQQVRAQRRSASRSVQAPFRVYLLSHLARCDVCRRHLRCHASAKEYPYYREMSYERGYADCPHTRQGTRTEPVDAYVHALVQALRLPPDWLDNVAQRMAADSELDDLQQQRRALEARRRRLKTMKMAGEFDEDADLYQQEQGRIRQALGDLPGYDALENLRATVASLKDLPETWAAAEPADQRDLLRLMLRRVRVDVPQKRVVAVEPQAVFIPIFRAVPLLQERELGVFVPVWPPEQAAQVVTLPHLPPLVEPPAATPLAPFLATNPLAPASKRRIAPGVSRALALCREHGGEPERVVQGRAAPLPLLAMDLRKWPRARAEALLNEETLQLVRESVDVLVTQFRLSAQPAGTRLAQTEALFPRIQALLKPAGVWYLQELLPSDMPAHWVFQFFPAAWRWARFHTWGLHALFNRLRAAGFAPQVARQGFYQPVSLGAALALAERRTGLLAGLSDADFAQGLVQLRQAVAERGAAHLVGSEVALVEVWAVKNV